MTHLLQFSRPALLAAGVLLLAGSPASATPAPQARAASRAITAFDLADASRLVQAIAYANTPSRQASPTAARRSPASDPAPDPQSHVGAANEAARIEPDNAGFDNAIQRYAYREGALFQVYAKPGQVTDIALQEGETLVGPGPVAAGDTVRWMIGDTLSGSGATQRVHILIKPTRPDIATNLVINTDRRSYHLELRATPETYMASVSWIYPRDELIALRNRNAVAASTAPVADGVDLSALNFRYRIKGDRVPWKPVRAFDDGRQVFIEFPAGIAQGEMPPLFVTGTAGDAELVNYRVRGRYMVVDRLFAGGELRLGDKRSKRRVQILRTDGRERR